MRLSLCAFSLAMFLALGAAACGPAANGDDAGTPDGQGNTCTGSETRCVGVIYETCSNGTFQTTQTCPTACNASLGGCVQCDPTAGNACNGNDVVTCNADGTYGSTVMSCGSGSTCAGGTCSRACTADGVDLIYLVDVNNDFLSFDPRQMGTAQGPFHVIGTLNCAGGTALDGSGPATPFSMSVDRTGKAWVLYNSGKIFNVDITTAACSDTTFVPQQENQAWSLFGMGYSSDAAGADTEKLYIAGGPVTPAAQQKFGYIDGTSLAVQDVGMINTGENSPELTGTGDAKLYGYFPGTTQNGFVQEIDKTTGHALGTAMTAGTVSGGPQAWAFAQWGGKFYIFVTDSNGDNQVQVVNRMTGAYEGVALDQTQYEVVGAGVSTCAPVNIP